MDLHIDFQKERREVINDIEEFLAMLLKYFTEMEQKRGTTITRGHQSSSLKKLFESLCFLHGLYGFPAEIEGLYLQDGVTPLDLNAKIEKILYSDDHKPDHDELQEAKELIRQTVINEYAIENIVKKIDTERSKEKKKTFSDYCGDVAMVIIEFKNFKDLPREPAHCFLQLVRDMFDEEEDEGNKKEDEKGDEKGDEGDKGKERNSPATVGRKFLELLSVNNTLKPRVWAHEKKKQHINFGVSLGVPKFVRPLYLCIKLMQLNNADNADGNCKLKDVEAIKIQHKGANKNAVKNPCANKDVFIDPCVSCQKMFTDDPILFPLGNCAEYDVIGKVDNKSLPKNLWPSVKKKCNNHFEAFKSMVEQLRTERNKTSEDILTEYYEVASNNRVKLQYNLTCTMISLKQATQ